MSDDLSEVFWSRTLGYNPADLFENAADYFGERECIVCDGKSRRYREMSVPEPESHEAS